MTTAPALLPDLRTTLVVVVEVSKTVWVIAAQVPGLQGTVVKQRLEPRAAALLAAIARLERRAADKGAMVERTAAAYESGGYSGFWLARVLRRAGIEVHVIQPVSVPVDRRARRAKTDAIDVDLLLRTCPAFLRGGSTPPASSRVCSMVPVPEEADEDARHPPSRARARRADRGADRPHQPDRQHPDHARGRGLRPAPARPPQSSRPAPDGARRAAAVARRGRDPAHARPARARARADRDPRGAA
jgi:transposase